MFDVILDIVSMTMWKSVLCILYPEYSFYIMLHAGLTIFGEWIYRHRYVSHQTIVT